MANDCLVTKLKSVVNNDNILAMGEIKIHSNVASDAVNDFNVNCLKIPQSVIIRIGENVHIYVGADEKQDGDIIPANADMYVKGIGDFYVKSYYEWTSIYTGTGLTIYDFIGKSIYMNYLTSANLIGGSYETLNKIRGHNNAITSLAYNDSSRNTIKDIDKIADIYPNLETLSIRYNTVIDSWTNVYKLSHLSTLRIEACSGTLDTELEDIIKGYIGNLKVTGELVIGLIYCSMKVKGTTMTGTLNITWTANSFTVNGTEYPIE